MIVAHTDEIGTIEMFNRESEDEFNHFGLLRIDLRSKYENQKYINEILQIVNQDFYKTFDVDSILIKAIQSGTERIASLQSEGYVPLDKKVIIYDDYYARRNVTN